MENNIFSLHRFSDFFVYEIIRSYKKLLLYNGIILGVLILAGIFVSMNCINLYIRPELWRYEGTDPVLSTVVSFYSTLFIIFGSMSVSLMWSEMKNKNGKLTLLMLPSSILEKYLVKIIIYSVIFILIFIIGVIIAESIRYLIFNAFFPDSNVLPLYLSSKYMPEVRDYIWQIFPTPMNHPIWFFIFLFFLIQSFFVLGASIWYSRSFIKTFLVFGTLILVYYVFSGITYDSFFHQKTGNVPPIFYWVGQHKYLCFLVLTLIVCIINRTLAYFRITESQLITTKR